MPNRTLQGVATIWTDNPLLSGPKGSHITVVLAIDSNTGQVKAVLEAINLGNDIILKQNGDGVGHYDFNSGNLDMNIPVHVDHVPTGNVHDTTVHLSTALAISPPNSGSITGVPAGSPGEATGSITLAGTTKVKATIDTPFGSITIADNTVWIRALGTLLPA